MNQIKYFLTHFTKTVCLFAIAIFIAGCASTEQVAWRTGITQAEIELPPDAKSIAILNRVRLAYPFNRTNSTVLNPNIPNVVNGALAGVRDRLNSQQHLRIIGTNNNYSVTTNGRFPQQLSVSDVRSVAKGGDLVLVLSMFSHSISDDYKLEIRRENLGNNTYREVDHFIGRRSIPVKLGWRLYDAKTGNLIDQWEQTEEYFYEAESRVRLRATNLLNANYQKELSNLGRKHGLRYASRISPTSHIRSMKIYSSGGSTLAEGSRYARADDWENAVNTWVSGVTSEKKGRVKAMLYHNLAVSAERSGVNIQARKYAKQAASYHPLGAETQSLVGF